MKILCTALVNTVSLALAVYLVCGTDMALVTTVVSVAILKIAITLAFYAAGFLMGES
jgi:hypothetical protein